MSRTNGKITAEEAQEMLRGKLLDPSGSRLHLKEFKENQFITRDNKLIINWLGDDEFELVLDDKILTSDVLGKSYGMRNLKVYKPEVDYIRSIISEPETVGFKLSKRFLKKQAKLENKETVINRYEFELNDPGVCPFTLDEWCDSLLRTLSINVHHYCGCHLDFSSNQYDLTKEMYFLQGVFKSGIQFHGKSQNAIMTRFLEACFDWPITITGLNEQQAKELEKQVENYKRYNIIVGKKKFKQDDPSQNIYILSKNKDVRFLDKIDNKTKKHEIFNVALGGLVDLATTLVSGYLQTIIL